MMKVMVDNRVPQELQNIFVESQGGKDVSKIQPPAKGIGSRTFGVFSPHKTKAPKAPGLSFLKRSRNTGGETASDSFRKANPKVVEKNVDPTSPHAFLDKELTSRGYSTKKYVSLEGGYYCRPTPLQKASYGSRLNQSVVKSDAPLLQRLLDAGLSPNPCNDFGESLIHRICRRGDHKLLQVLLAAGCSLQIADDYGRTPLHDAFWKADPSPETLSLIIKEDKNLLFLMDCRGFCPLDYVRKEAYPEMIQFLQSNLDEYFPAGAGDQRPPPLTLRQPHSTPIPDPRLAVSPEVATLVSNGEIDPEDAHSWEEEYSEYDSDESYDSDDSYDSDLDIDEMEMAEICMRAGGPLAVARNCFGDQCNVMSRSRKIN